MFCESDVSRNLALLGLAAMDALQIGCFQGPGVPKLAAMDALRIGCFQEPGVTKWAAIDALRMGRGTRSAMCLLRAFADVACVHALHEPQEHLQAEVTAIRGR